MPDLDYDVPDLATRLEAVGSMLSMLSMHERWSVACAIAEDGTIAGHPATRLANLLDPATVASPIDWLDDLDSVAQDLEAWLDDPDDISYGASSTELYATGVSNTGLSAGGLDILTADDEDYGDEDYGDDPDD